MATYLVLNLAFLVLALIVAIRLNGVRSLTSKPRLISLAVLLLLTAVFDNLLIAGGIVAYEESKMLGLFVGIAPVEDFFYSLVAVLLLPALWEKLRAIS